MIVFSVCNVPKVSVLSRPVYRTEGRTVLLDALYPTAMFPTLSIPMLPIQRRVESGAYVPC